MSEKPPPLPGLENLESPVKTVEVRMAPPHAPLLWRTVAFLVDISFLGLLGYLITTRFLIPQYMGEELAVYNGWADEGARHTEELARAISDGRVTDPLIVFREAIERAKNAPAGVSDLIVYFCNSMTVIYWVGFSIMEIAMRGSSLGKKMCRLRTASFPYCGRPGILDSVIRSGWKAMSIGSASPLIWLFAILDAHWPLFNPLRRSLHDVLCRTVVLDARFDPPEPPRDDEEDDE